MNANLKTANLKEADLTRTKFAGADLRDADLTDATGLTIEQIKSARGYEKAKFSRLLAVAIENSETS